MFGVSILRPKFGDGIDYADFPIYNDMSLNFGEPRWFIEENEFSEGKPLRLGVSTVMVVWRYSNV